MNTFWLKFAGIALVIVVVVVAIAYFTAGEPEPKQPTKTVYDQWEEDEEKLTAEPQYKERTEPQHKEPATPQQPSQQPTAREDTTAEAVEPPKPQFKKLSPEEEVEAQRKWQWVLNQRKMGRLPVMGYGQMVKACREIIRRWPGSEYAFYAKRALGDLSQRYKKMYNITDEETDLGDFK